MNLRTKYRWRDRAKHFERLNKQREFLKTIEKGILFGNPLSRNEDAIPRGLLRDVL